MQRHYVSTLFAILITATENTSNCMEDSTMARDKKTSIWRSLGKFAAVTIPLGVAGGLLLYGISELGTKRETVYIYDENGEKHVRRIRYKPLIWLYALLECIPFPWNLLLCKGKKIES